MSYRNIPLYVNTSTGKLLDSANGTANLNGSSIPTVYLGETVVFNVYLLNADLSQYVCALGDVFELSIDSDFDHDTDLMAYSSTPSVDISGDWSGISRTEGKISVRVSCATDAFASKLGASSNKSVYIELKRYASGSASPSTLLQDSLIAKNTVKDDESEPAESDPLYYTAAQTDSLLSTRMSVDGSTLFGMTIGTTYDFTVCPASSFIAADVLIAVRDSANMNIWKATVYNNNGVLNTGFSLFSSTVAFNAATFRAERAAGGTGEAYRNLGWQWGVSIADGYLVLSVKATASGLSAFFGSTIIIPGTL